MTQKRNSLRWIALIVVVLLVVAGARWWDRRADGFQLEKIQSTPLADERWDITFSDEDLQAARAALSQPFYYLGHGFQCYAFVSADNKYVIKFFRHQRLRLPEYAALLPDIAHCAQWKRAKEASLARRYAYLLRSCKTSWDLARHETIMMMVHLNRTAGLFPSIQIVDGANNSYHIDLDNYQFLLQRKAVHVKPTIAALMEQGKIDEAKRRIDSIFDLFITCAQKGIADTDGALIRKNNLGFFEERAIYIDGGKLEPRKKACTRKDFEKDLSRLYMLHKWLAQEYPVLAQHFVEAKAEAIASIPN